MISSFLTHISHTYYYHKDFLEHYCVHDQGSMFSNHRCSRRILKGFIINEIFFDMTLRGGRVNSDLIVDRRKRDQIALLKKRFSWTDLYQWWLIGCGNMNCLPKELPDLIKKMFVLPLFI
jgi:hypothetical protein